MFFYVDKALIFHNAKTLEADIVLTVFDDNFQLDGLPSQSDLLYKFKLYTAYILSVLHRLNKENIPFVTIVLSKH